jgi:hypothetical protein
VIVGVDVVVTVAVGAPVLVAVCVNTGVFVLITVVFVGTAVPVFVGVFVLSGVFVNTVGVLDGVGDGPGVELTFDANPGNPHSTLDAPKIAPAAFTGRTTAQISPPVPGSSAVRPGVTITPSVPTPHAM